MAEDLEVGVMLDVDESQLEEVEDKQVGVAGGGGGDTSPAERDKQESVVAGGVSKGLLAAGVLAGILSQLKAVTGIVSAVLGAISRALIPIIEDVADLIRPFVQFANQAATNVGGATQTVETVSSLTGVSSTVELLQGDLGGALSESPAAQLQEFRGEAISGGIGFIEQVFGSNTADQSGEATKQQLKNNADDAERDRLGATK